MTRPMRTALFTAAVGALVLATAAPVAAAGGSAKSTSYAATWSFSGTGVSAAMTNRGSGVELTDYSPVYGDRVTANPGVNERVTLVLPTGPVTCPSTNYFGGGLSLYGADPDWSHRAVTTGTVRIGCTINGEVDHFYWGGASSATTSCLSITRADASHFGLKADGCDVEDRVVSSSGVTLRSKRGLSLPFTAEITTARPVL